MKLPASPKSFVHRVPPAWLAPSMPPVIHLLKPAAPDKQQHKDEAPVPGEVQNQSSRSFIAVSGARKATTHTMAVSLHRQNRAGRLVGIKKDKDHAVGQRDRHRVKLVRVVHGHALQIKDNSNALPDSQCKKHEGGRLVGRKNIQLQEIYHDVGLIGNCNSQGREQIIHGRRNMLLGNKNIREQTKSHDMGLIENGNSQRREEKNRRPSNICHGVQLKQKSSVLSPFKNNVDDNKNGALMKDSLRTLKKRSTTTHSLQIKNSQLQAKEHLSQIASIGIAMDKTGTGRCSDNSVELDSCAFLFKAKELKEEGHRQFQRKDYDSALASYEQALELTPQNHPDRAVLHSNRAACLMQMQPVQYNAAIQECSLALEVHPGFSRALLHRAKAYEALGKLDLAHEDVQTLVRGDGDYPDALDLLKRLQCSLGSLEGTQQCFEGVHITPCSTRNASVSHSTSHSSSTLSSPKTDSHSFLTTEGQTTPSFDERMNTIITSPDQKCDETMQHNHSEATTQMRALKLVYHGDIRLAKLPANCKFAELRKMVKARFPSSKSVLIKYKDLEGDLVTITSLSELRLAEAAADIEGAKRSFQAIENLDITVGLHSMPPILHRLKLHVCEVSPEQEPIVEEEYVTVDRTLEGVTYFATGSGVDGKPDEWLVGFAHLFHTHLGIGTDALDALHDGGMELFAEALEEAIACEQAEPLFALAISKFQEVAARAFLTLGNIHMCIARKQLPMSSDVDINHKLQAAFDWAQFQFSLAKEKFEKGLEVKPDFPDVVFALAQRDFEDAKLHWSFAIAQKVDLCIWDASGTLGLFMSAERRIERTIELFKEIEECHRYDVLETDAQNYSSKIELSESQLNLFWGNVLYEHSQVEYRLGLTSWHELLDAALNKFEMAGVSPSELSDVMQKHLSFMDHEMEKD